MNLFRDFTVECEGESDDTEDPQDFSVGSPKVTRIVGALAPLLDPFGDVTERMAENQHRHDLWALLCPLMFYLTHTVNSSLISLEIVKAWLVGSNPIGSIRGGASMSDPGVNASQNPKTVKRLVYASRTTNAQKDSGVSGSKLAVMFRRICTISSRTYSSRSTALANRVAKNETPLTCQCCGI